ncbi:Rieske (2Fe-2S) protein [Paenibacillus thalictri]|uniref:Rieske (2Fe-2S) protein n=1 Tax=Paenibacillus thalictri TaxID=2527873 RepID=A0A4Q9DL06_9BACL|nr:Rieske (2Fe-2S) protein [Paenibacillus thalictri]TBL71571.1 Rieske (2Fe-2S) protein [Paenibacillus thalictri]
MGRHVVCNVKELPDGSSKIVSLENRSIGVFHVKSRFYALKNSCPHQGAPLCVGTVTGMTLPSLPGEYLYGKEGEIVRCPWHGWEFDILTGKSIYDPRKCLVKTYDVAVETEEEVKAVETYTVKVEEEKVVVYI